MTQVESGGAAQNDQHDRTVWVVSGDPLVLLGVGHPLTQLARRLQLHARTANLITDQERSVPGSGQPPGLHHDHDRLPVTGDASSPRT